MAAVQFDAVGALGADLRRLGESIDHLGDLVGRHLVVISPESGSVTAEGAQRAAVKALPMWAPLWSTWQKKAAPASWTRPRSAGRR